LPPKKIKRVRTGTPKALQTSAQPGHTRALSTRLKLSEDPLVYSYDSPGVMLPFLGKGNRGAERGVKLALIGKINLIIPALFAEKDFATAGIKESLYDVEALVAYLLYRLNILNPICVFAPLNCYFLSALTTGTQHLHT
jgi:hypothetical protein